MTTPGYTWDRDDSGLTAREREALRLSAEGLSLRKIGAEMGVTHTRAGALLRSARAKQATTADPKPSDV